MKLSGPTVTLTEASNLIDELYKKGEIQTEQHYRNAPNKFHIIWMELPCRILKQIAFNTRSKIEEHMLIVMEKSTHKQLLCQSPQTNNKQFKLAITFLKCYSGIFNVTISNKKFFFAKSVTDKDGFIQSTIPKGAYEIESLIDEIKRIVFDEGHFTEADRAFQN